MTQGETATAGRGRQITKAALAMGVSLVVSLLAAEIVVRQLGRNPWRPFQVDIDVDPGGRLFQVDPTVGYTLLPGRFRITHRTGYSWQATHGPDTFRITEPGTSDAYDARSQIWIFGCSYTYGWSVNNNETYPWLLQKRFPQKNIVNFGVGGYGTVNSLLQFQEALRTRGTPDLVVVAYASFHNSRNTLLRQIAKTVVPFTDAFGSRWRPYARFGEDADLVIEISELEYREFPLMRRSALVHLAERVYNNLEYAYYDSDEVTKSLLESFAALARQHDIRFVIAGIDPESAVMLDALSAEGIETLSIAVDLTPPGRRNEPHDSHPSAKTHMIYARRLVKYIRRSYRESY